MCNKKYILFVYLQIVWSQTWLKDTKFTGTVSSLLFKFLYIQRQLSLLKSHFVEYHEISLCRISRPQNGSFYAIFCS
jgi:hypothetical protein